MAGSFFFLLLNAFYGRLEIVNKILLDRAPLEASDYHETNLIRKNRSHLDFVLDILYKSHSP